MARPDVSIIIPVYNGLEYLRRLLTTLFERTPDILRTIAPLKRAGQRFYGFAAETDNLEAEALRKLASKRLGGIFANDVSKPGAGMAAPLNQVVLYTPDAAPRRSPMLPKAELANLLAEWILG